MEAIIILAVIIFIIWLIIKFVLPFLLIVLVAGGVVGLFAGSFFGVRNYILSTYENMNNKALKITMIFITSIFVLVFLGGIIYFSPSEQIKKMVATASSRPNTTNVVANTETWTEKIVTSDGLNVRSGPSTDYAVKFVLYRNTIVKVSNKDKSGDWVKISHNNNGGFVNGRYLKER